MAADQDARQRLDCHPRSGQDMFEQELTAAEDRASAGGWKESVSLDVN
jgi:hypothetical protein